jgi:signal transduction histidine kinase
MGESSMADDATKQQIAQLEEKVAILTRLAEISASLNSRVEIRPLLKQIMDSTVQILGCEAASVLLWDDRRQQLFFAASTTVDHTDSDLIGMAVPMDSIAGTIYRENRFIQVDDARADPRHYDKVDEDIAFETRSLLGVPMTYKDTVIGVLEAINKRDLPWTDDDRHYLGIIAAQAAVAIEGARLVMRLRKVNEELSELDKLKNDFIAIASHELRTPLGVIMGYASFLQEEESPSAKANASKVLESAIKLRKIIEDMVNLRYLKQKQGDLYREEVQVSALLHSLREEINALMDLTEYDFRVEPPDDDAKIYIDHTRINMALTNILHNAIRFSEPGDRITLRAEAHDDAMHIIVEDTGAGIEPDELDNIFDEFYQVEDHMTRKHGGLGIGLSIAKAIVAAHGGRIRAESEGSGEGARFILMLPLVNTASE